MRTYITLAAVVLTCGAIAQSPYRPFPNSGAIWVVARQGLQFGCNPVEVFTVDDQVQLGPEVTVDGLVYNELIRSSLGTWTAVGPPAGGPCPPGGVISALPAVVGHIRQDIAARKVYLGPDSTDLLYDFTIGLGTYPPTVDNYLYPSLKVVALDSMELNDGYHRTWVLGIDEGNGLHDSAFCSIIEGIGSTYGLQPFGGLAPPFEFTDLLTCFSVGQTAILPLGAVECGIAMGMASADRGTSVALFPNPTSAHLRVDNAPVNARCSILDVTGRPVRYDVLNGSQLDVSDLPAALYMLRITDQGGTPIFVKE